MFRRSEDTFNGGLTGASGEKSTLVVAGPGTSLSIPGIIVSEIVEALAQSAMVSRIEVDPGVDFMAGLHRARSLAAAHDAFRDANVVVHRAPNNARFRSQAFRDWITPDVSMAIAYAWPGIENGWIRQFIQVARSVGASTVVACASLPASSLARAISLAGTMSLADLILVGDERDAADLRSAYGPSRPRVETHRAMSLGGRSVRTSVQEISAFLQKDNIESLSTLLVAFDAIPEAWIERYRLKVVMRYSGSRVPDLVARSYHAKNVQLIGEDISTIDLEKLYESSSALIVADPTFDSRAFSMAVDCGIATVVLAPALNPNVGRGYVGGLLADLDRPVSVHVALTHALRLGELRFPRPDAWEDLARRLLGSPPLVEPQTNVLESTVEA